MIKFIQNKVVLPKIIGQFGKIWELSYATMYLAYNLLV